MQVTSSCGRGGTGRRARLKSWSRKGWRFKSSRPHRPLSKFTTFALVMGVAHTVSVACLAPGCPRRARSLRSTERAGLDQVWLYKWPEV